ncbi:hypothetical protein B0H13DRAFT_2532486 [Mycena leptocephala]|nr:hypothetical protein B0H13DRAFT_2532486 [Mycena leptocephala]
MVIPIMAPKTLETTMMFCKGDRDMKIDIDQNHPTRPGNIASHSAQVKWLVSELQPVIQPKSEASNQRRLGRKVLSPLPSSAFPLPRSVSFSPHLGIFGESLQCLIATNMDPATVVNAVSPYVMMTNVRNAEVRSALESAFMGHLKCGSIALPGGARRDEGINLWKLLVLLSGSTGQQSPPTLVPCTSTRSIRTQDDALK